MSTAGPSNSATTNQGPSVQNIAIRVPKGTNKKLSIMRFNASTGIDFSKWDHPKMERENNQVQFKSFTEEMPKFGAGSEYGREQREEARRKKYGIISKKYKPEDQPWILQCGKNGRKFKGVREGGVAENASYYVFTQAHDGAFEAFPIQEWYNFTAYQSYKALSYEEAEEEFNSRNRTYNLFNVMMRKRMKKDDELDDEDGEGDSKKKGKAKKSRDSRFGDDLDDMESSDDDSGSENGDDEDGGKSSKKKKGKKPAKPKKRKNNSDDEAFEDSDDGDGEGRELDYISSSDDESDSDLETKAKDELKGVAEEDALRKLLNSDEEDEEENQEKPDESENKEDDEGEENNSPKGDKSKDEKGEKKKKDKKNKDKKPRKEDYGSSSDSSGESSSSELDKPKPSPKVKPGSANSSRSATPTKPLLSMPETSSDSKKRATSDVSLSQAAKKARLDTSAAASASSPTPSSSSAGASSDGVNEETVRRYLSRKPMTTTELLQKFKSKKTTLSSDQLVSQIALILKKINPNKQTIKGKMYLSIKE